MMISILLCNIIAIFPYFTLVFISSVNDIVEFLYSVLELSLSVPSFFMSKRPLVMTVLHLKFFSYPPLCSLFLCLYTLIFPCASLVHQPLIISLLLVCTRSNLSHTSSPEFFKIQLLSCYFSV